MQTHAFDFDLPQELIALHPCFPRDSARLLCVKEGGGLSDHHIRDLGQLLNRGDLLIVNDTRVLPASLKAKRRRQGDQGETVMLDITLHQPSISSVTSAADGEGVCWSSFVRPAKRLRPGDELIFGEKYEARVEQQLDTGQVLLRFHLSDSDFTDFIENQGMMPLPPYIARKRPVTDKDREDYQTMFALHNGSVAAPTAGLHFTPSLLERLKEKGIDTASVTLHVGAGTFLPVKTEYIEDHSMHAEYYTIGPETAEKILEQKRRGGVLSLLEPQAYVLWNLLQMNRENQRLSA